MNAEPRSIRVTAAPTNGSAQAHATNGETAEALTPAIDIHETPTGLILEADLPGVSESSLHIELEQNVLHLRAKASRPIVEGARALHEESPVEDFYRSFILSDEVDRNKIQAELKQGVLRVVLPRAEQSAPRRIEVKSS